MSWQSPPFDPTRAKLWKGGFTRVFGCVGDGVADTLGLRRWCPAYMVLVDHVVLDASLYSVVYPNLVLSTPPDEGAWVEIVGFGVPSDVPVSPNKWVRDSWQHIRNLSDGVPIGAANRFTWTHNPQHSAGDSSGAYFSPDTGKVILMPGDYDAVHEVDPETADVIDVDCRDLDLYHDNKFAGGYLGSDGNVYAVPDGAAYVAKYDPRTRRGKMIPVDDFQGEPVWTDHMFECGATLVDTSWGIPFDAKYFLEFNLTTGETKQTEEVFDLSMPGKWSGVVYHGVNAYAVPYNHHSILKIEPDGTKALIPLNTPGAELASKYRDGCEGSDGALYFAPFNADHILRFDPVTEVSSEIQLDDIDLSGRFKFWGCAATGGEIVFAPHDYKWALKYDVSDRTGVLTRFDFPGCDEIFDRNFAFRGANTDQLGQVRLCSYMTPVDVVYVPGHMSKTWRQKTRPTLREGRWTEPNHIAFGCGAGLVLHMPRWSNPDTPWETESGEYAVDAYDTNMPWGDEKDGTFDAPHNPLYLENRWYRGDDTRRWMTGMYDFGDLRYLQQDDGEIKRDRMSGMELYAEQHPALEGDDPDTREIYYKKHAGYINTKFHYPRYDWARNDMVYGLLDTEDKLVSQPYSQPLFLQRDKTFTRSAMGEVEPDGPDRTQWFNGQVMGADGNIWGIPYNSPHVMRFVVATEQAWLDNHGIDMLMRRKWFGGVRAGNYIYGIPWDYPGVLRIDTDTGVVDVTDFGLDLTGTSKYRCGEYRDGKVYMIPCSAGQFLVIDVATQTAELTYLTDLQVDIDYLENNTLKWGACGTNQTGQIVFGALGTSSLSGGRAQGYIDEDGVFKTVKRNGLPYIPLSGSYYVEHGMTASMYISGWLIFRRGTQFTLGSINPPARPWRAPAVMPETVTSTTAAILSAFRTTPARWTDMESVYVIDHWVYGMVEGYDRVLSVATEDWSTYNEREEAAPGTRGIGYVPAALTRYDDDLKAAYPPNELTGDSPTIRAMQKESLWCDPTYVGNNTAYALNCNSGIIVRTTVDSYNHLRGYLRETHNHGVCYYGAVDHEGKVYAVPNSMALSRVYDPATKQVEVSYADPYPGWLGEPMWRDGTSFDGQVVFFPANGNDKFCYHDPVAGTYEHIQLPDEHRVLEGWSHWVRRGDEVFGVPYYADYVAVWDLAQKTITRRVEFPSDAKWKGKMWSDGMFWQKDTSDVRRDPTFLLPYNNEKLAVAYQWGTDAKPEIDEEFFDSTFPGTNKWSVWAAPDIKAPYMYGVPEDADKILCLDVRGEEPWLDDFGITLTNGWAQEGKWKSCVNVKLGMYSATFPSGRPFTIFIPYNASDILAVDWNTNKVYKVEYSGASLAGTGKWWGGWQVGSPVAQYNNPPVCFVPYNAAGFLEVTFTIEDRGDDIAVVGTGILNARGISMGGTAKWRGCVFMRNGWYNSADTYVALCIPANHTRFLAVYYQSRGALYELVVSSVQLLQVGIPDVILQGTDKWGPVASTTNRNVDLGNDFYTREEYMFPAWNHEHSLRVANNANLPQAWSVPHRQPDTRRGWVPTRPHPQFTPYVRGTRSWFLPWTSSNFLMHNGSEADEFDAGFNPERQEKFGSGAYDSVRDRLLFAPWGGMSLMWMSPDTGESGWVEKSTEWTGACSGIGHIHASDTGRVYMFAHKDYLKGRGPLPHQGDIYVDSRPILTAGDGWIIDTALDLRDSHHFWPRWNTFDWAPKGSRMSCPIVPDTCCPPEVYGPNLHIAYFGAIATGETGWVMLPGTSGMAMTHRLRRGRSYSKKQMQWSGEPSAENGYPRQQPHSGRFPHVYNGTLFFFETGGIGGMETAGTAGNNIDPLYYTGIDLATQRTTFYPLDLRFGADTNSTSSTYTPAPAGRYVHWLPTSSDLRLTEAAVHLNRIFTLDLDTGEVTRNDIVLDRQSVCTPWYRRPFKKTTGETYWLGRSIDYVWSLNCFATDSDGRFSGYLYQFVEYLGDLDLEAAAWDPDAGILYVARRRTLGVPKQYVDNGWTVDLEFSSINVATGVRSISALTLHLVGAGIPTTVTVGSSVFHDGRIYISMSDLHVEDRAWLNEEMYVVSCLPDGSDVQVETYAGVPTANTQFGFSKDGGIWFVYVTRKDGRTFVRLDPTTKLGELPYDGGYLVSVRNTNINALPFVATYAELPGGDLVFTPTQWVSRTVMAYIAGTKPGDFYLGTRSWHDVKVYRKWCSAVEEDGSQYGWGMPLGTNRLLRIDRMLDRADQHEVQSMPHAPEWENEISPNTVYGHIYNGILHRSDPSEGVCASSIMDRRGVIVGVPYGGRMGQGIEILPDGHSTMRVPGPSYYGDRKWAGGVQAEDGFIYAAPFDAEEVLTIDPENQKAGTSFANLYLELKGKAKWAAAVRGATGSGFVYMLPYSNYNALKVDPKGRLLSIVEFPGVDLSAQEKWWTSFEHDGSHFLVPYRDERVGIFNPADESWDFIDVPDGLDGELEGRWRAAAEARDGKWYAAPYNARDMLAIDPETRTVERFLPSMRFVGSNKWLHAIMDNEADIAWLYGGSRASVLKLDFSEGDPKGLYVEAEAERNLASLGPDVFFASARTLTLGSGEDSARAVNLYPTLGRGMQVYNDADKGDIGLQVATSGDFEFSHVVTTPDETYYLPTGGTSIARDNNGNVQWITLRARLPDADKYGEPSVVNGKAYFPPKGSGSWLCLWETEQDVLAARVFHETGSEGGTLNEMCAISLPMGRHVVAPSVGDGYFLILDTETGITDKGTFGFGAGFWGAFPEDPPMYASGDYVWAQGVDGTIVRCGERGAVEVPFEFLAPDVMDGVVLHDDADGERITWVNTWSRPSATDQLRDQHCASIPVEGGQLHFAGGRVYRSRELPGKHFPWVITDKDRLVSVGMYRRTVTSLSLAYGYRNASTGKYTFDQEYNSVNDGIDIGRTYIEEYNGFPCVSAGKCVWLNVQSNRPAASAASENYDGFPEIIYKRLNGDIIRVRRYEDEVGFHRMYSSGYSVGVAAATSNGWSDRPSSGGFRFRFEAGGYIYCAGSARYVMRIERTEDTVDNVEFFDFGLDWDEVPENFDVGFEVDGRWVLAGGGKLVILDFEDMLGSITTTIMPELFDSRFVVLPGREGVTYLARRDRYLAYRLEAGIVRHEEEVTPEPDPENPDPDPVMTISYTFGGRLVSLGVKPPNMATLSVTTSGGTMFGSILGDKSGDTYDSEDVNIYHDSYMSASFLRFSVEEGTVRWVGLHIVGSSAPGGSRVIGRSVRAAVPLADDNEEGYRLLAVVYTEGTLTSTIGLHYIIYAAELVADGLTGWLAWNIYSTSIAASYNVEAFIPKTVGRKASTWLGSPSAGELTAAAVYFPTYWFVGRVEPFRSSYLRTYSTTALPRAFSFGIEGTYFLDDDGSVTRVQFRQADTVVGMTTFPVEITYESSTGRRPWYSHVYKDDTLHILPCDASTSIEVVRGATTGYLNILIGVTERREKYRTAIQLNDTQALLIPWTGLEFALYNLDTRVFEETLLGMEASDLTGAEKFKYARFDEDNRRVVVLPYRKNYLVIIDVDTMTAETKQLPMLQVTPSGVTFGDWFYRNGLYYGVPADSEDIYTLDVDTLEMERVVVGLNLGDGPEKWACGYPTSVGNITFPPYNNGYMLAFDPTTRAADLVTPGGSQNLHQLTPVGKVVRWWNNLELHPDNSYKPGVSDSEIDVPDQNLTYDWLAFSHDTGAARYDRETGDILSTPSQWPVYETIPQQQYLDFIYTDNSGLIFGIPHNARSILVARRGSANVSCTQSSMTLDLKVKGKFHYVEVRNECDYTWLTYLDNFLSAGYNNNFDPVYAAGGSEINVWVDPFNGMLTSDHIFDLMEWNRPTWQPYAGDQQPIDYSIWSHLYHLFGSSALGPDGVLYMFSQFAEWGLVARGISGADDKLFVPIKVVPFTSRFHKGRYEYPSEVMPIRGSAVADNGRIVIAPGLHVTMGAFTAEEFSTREWHELVVTGSRFRELDDARGTVVERRRYWIPVMDTGYIADVKALVVTSPRINNK